MRLLFVLAFHEADLPAVERLGKWMRKLSNNQPIADQALFCGKGLENAENASGAFKGLFRDTTSFPIENEVSGWPRGCNYQFLKVARYINDHRHDVDAFYYFEPDCLPMRRDWWQKILAEYSSCGKPFWGMEQPNVEGDKINGTHMIGTGIYPRDAYSRIKIYSEMDKERPDVPWDTAHRHEVNPQCYFTNLAMHQADMRNYTPDGYAEFPIHFQGRGRHPISISPEICVLHGCKDDSLMTFWGVKLRLPRN